MVAYRARMNLKNKIEAGDIDASKYWLDRKDKEFKQKQDITSDDNSYLYLVKFISNEEDRNTN